MKISSYVRTKGAICYEGFFFKHPEALQKFAKEASEGLVPWFWASERRKPLPAHSPFRQIPNARPLTPLDAARADLFVSDYSERDIDGELRFICLIAVSRKDSEVVSQRDKLSCALEIFDAEESGPLLAVLVQLGDSPDLLFTPHHPSTAILSSLALAGVALTNVESERNYAGLRLAKLDHLSKNLLEISFRTET